MKHLILYTFFIIAIISCESKDESVVSEKQYVNNKNWIGDWERETRLSEATLSIENISNDIITFSLTASSGGHTGDIEGQAYINGDSGLFDLNSVEDNCIIEFYLKGDSIIMVNQKVGDCFTGMGVTYTGKYTNSKYLKKQPKKEADLVSLSVLENYHQDSIFRKLVGEDYDKFISSTQMMSEDNDIDSLKTRVVSSGVRGLFTFMENIVMVNPDDNIWAAVIDDKKILYFTNRTDFMVKLPNTINKWRENFNEYEIVYKSKP